MAFYCLDCINKLSNKKYEAKRVVFSECLYVCEGCGDYKTVVIMTKRQDTDKDTHNK